MMVLVVAQRQPSRGSPAEAVELMHNPCLNSTRHSNPLASHPSPLASYHCSLILTFASSSPARHPAAAPCKAPSATEFRAAVALSINLP